MLGCRGWGPHAEPAGGAAGRRAASRLSRGAHLLSAGSLPSEPGAPDAGRMQAPPGNPLLLSLTLQELLARDAVQVELVPEKKGLFLKHVEYAVSSQVHLGGGGGAGKTPSAGPRVRPWLTAPWQAPALLLLPRPWDPASLDARVGSGPDELALGGPAVLGSPWEVECGPRTADQVCGRDWCGGLTPRGFCVPVRVSQGQSESGAGHLAPGWPYAGRPMASALLIFCPLPVTDFSWDVF